MLTSWLPTDTYLLKPAHIIFYKQLLTAYYLSKIMEQCTFSTSVDFTLAGILFLTPVNFSSGSTITKVFGLMIHSVQSNLLQSPMPCPV